MVDELNNKIRLVECPRDAMQGWQKPIATQTKIAYLNTLLEVGFDTLDCGSFVSPKAIPQMADTRQVIGQINKVGSTKILVIVANTRGAEEAVTMEKIDCLGFPFSISPTFQQLNTNSTQQQSLERIDAIQNLCVKHEKQLVVYLSMGFGNPYGDAYDQEIMLKWADEMVQRKISVISVADTVGLATPGQISFAMRTLIPAYSHVEFGVHLHSSQVSWREKLEAAFKHGCTRFDGALKGIGGCPMANSALVGNMNTEWMIDYFEEKNCKPLLNDTALQQSLQMAAEIFE